jgi:hypothetical protein
MNNTVDQDSLEHLDIRVYNTVSGRQLIGEFQELYDDTIVLNSPLEMVRVQVQQGIAVRMVNAVPQNEGEPMHLYLHAVESESFASDALKQSYYKQLVIDRISSLFTESYENGIKGDEQTLTDLDPPDSFKHDCNGSADRWKN